MATPQFLTFPSTLAPVIPTFAGNGSKLEHPDLQVVFWGPYWPGSGQLTVGGLMQAVSSMVTGPYLEGMKQYGYVGPVNLRQPIVNTGSPNIVYPAPGPNVSQVNAALGATYGLVDSLRQNDAMGDVTSNHDLLVLVFLDPSIPFPQTFNAAGTSSGTVFGEHSKYEVSRILAPAIRFAYGWVCTQPGVGLSAFDQATWTFSHELVEAISNPFVGSGWVQTSPASAANSGEIGDVCNNTACVVDSIVVQPYWGIQQAACILPTEGRIIWLDQTQSKHVPHDSPTQSALVDMGPLCGKGNFDYVERTWDNAVTVTVSHPGYQVPIFSWFINGQPLPAGNSTMLLPATWEAATRTINFSLLSDSIEETAASRLAGLVGSGHQLVLNPGSPLANAALRVQDHAVFATPATAGGAPATAGPLHANTATLRISVFSSVVSIECGPGQGNVSFEVECQAVENWDGNAGTTVTTKQTNRAIVDMTNQEIIWGSAYQQAAKNCYENTHKVAGGGGFPGIPHNPGDPEQGQVINQVDKMKEVQQVETLKEVNQVHQLQEVQQINQLGHSVQNKKLQ